MAKNDPDGVFTETKETELARLQARVAELRQQLAEETARFKVGDKVVWSHGRKQRRKGFVMRVSPTSTSRVEYAVEFIKKDGTRGATMYLRDYAFENVEKESEQ